MVLCILMGFSCLISVKLKLFSSYLFWVLLNFLKEGNNWNDMKFTIFHKFSLMSQFNVEHSISKLLIECKYYNGWLDAFFP